MKQLVARTAVVLFALAGPAASEVLIEARYWPADLSGRLVLENLENNEFFTGIDPINDLGLEEDGIYEARLVFRSRRQTAVRVAWQPLTFAGDATITGAVAGVPVAPRVQTELDLDYARFAFAWQFLASKDGRFRLGPMIEAKAFQGDARVSVDNPIVPIVETTDFETGLPSAGLMLDLEPSDKVQVFAEMTVLVDTSEGNLTDAEAGVRYFVTPTVAITAGYRLIQIDVEDRADLLEIDIESVFVGAAVRF